MYVNPLDSDHPNDTVRNSTLETVVVSNKAGAGTRTATPSLWPNLDLESSYSGTLPNTLVHGQKRMEAHPFTEPA
jgi:hypothetical protein